MISSGRVEDWTNTLLEPQKFLFQSDGRPRRRGSAATGTISASGSSSAAGVTSYADLPSTASPSVSTIVSMMPAAQAGTATSGDHHNVLYSRRSRTSGGDNPEETRIVLPPGVGDGRGRGKGPLENRVVGLQAAATAVTETFSQRDVGETDSKVRRLSSRGVVPRGDRLGTGVRNYLGVKGVMDPHQGPVDRLLALVSDGQSLAKRVLGNKRQSARLGERLSALKTPLWQLQAKVRTQAEEPPDFIYTLNEEVSNCVDVLQELTDPDWWNQICRKDDAAVFRNLNERLITAVRGVRQFESALNFPRAADEDRGDRIVDFDNLQGILELHAERLEDRSEEREELWKAIADLRLSEPPDITGFVEIDRAQLTFGSGMPLGGSGSCLEATWHGARVAVKRLLPPVKFGSGGGVGSRIGAGRGGNATRLFSAAEASAVRREMRALQSLRFDFLLPIYGACTAPPDGVSLVMPLAPHGSLYALLHHGSGEGSGSSGIGSGSDPSEASRGGSRHGGVLRRGISRSSSVLGHSVIGPSSQAAGSGGGSGAGSDSNGGDGTGGRGRARLSAAEKAAMAFDIARGMLHLHDNGFLHGALKSKNVLVFENNRMVISDYGLSAVKSIRDKGSASEAGCFFGKKRSTRNVPPPAGSGSEEVVRGRGQKEEDPWVAPEVFAGGEHTQQSDLYSYGGILFELLAEQLPPSLEARGLLDSVRESDQTFSMAVAEEHFGGCSEAAWTPKVPQGVEAHLGQVQLMQRCLRHEGENRPGGFYVIVSFLHDLVKSLGGDERRSRSSRMLPMPLLPNDSQGGEVEGEGTPPSLRRLAGTAEGSEDASKEALQNALEAQARLERRLAAAEARCKDLEESERNATEAAAEAIKAAATAKASTAAEAASVTGKRDRVENNVGESQNGGRLCKLEGEVDANGDRGAEGNADTARKLDEIEYTRGDRGGVTRVGRLNGSGNGRGDSDAVIPSSGKTSESHNADSLEGERDDRRGGGLAGTGVQSESTGILELQANGGGVVMSPAGEARQEGLSTQLEAGREREIVIRAALEELRRNEEAMREELVRGLASMRVLRAQLKEGAKAKRREEEFRAAGTATPATAATNAASAAGEDSVLTAKLSPSSASASAPSVTSLTSVASLLEVEQQHASSFMAGEPAGGRLSQRFATSTLALVNNSNSGDLSSRRNSASSGISNISCGGGGGNSVFTSTPGVSTSEAVEVEGSAASASSPSSSPAGVGAVAGAADTIGRINEDGRTVGASSSSRPVVVPTSRDVKDWELRSTKVLSSSEQLKVAAASMLKSDPAHDLGASASSVVGREGQELRKIKRRVGRLPEGVVGSSRSSYTLTASVADTDRDQLRGGGSSQSTGSTTASSSMSSSRRAKERERLAALSLKRQGQRRDNVGDMRNGAGDGDNKEMLRRERLLRKQFYQEKTVAEAEVSRLRKALNAKSAAATTVTGQEVSFIPGTNGTNGIDASAGAVNSGSATSDLGVAIGGGNKDKATNVSTADALNTSVTSSPTAVSPYTSPVISVDEKSGVKSGGGSGGSLAPAATVGQQQHMRQHTLPTSSAVMRFSESPVVERQQEHLQEQKYPQLYHHCSYSVGGNGTDVDGFIGGRRTGTGPTAESIDDRFALSLLFRSCHGQRWLRRSGWSAGTDDMVGVAWTSDMSRVIKLELGTNRVEGCIPKELGFLSRLLCLRLDHNHLLGMIPPELGCLTTLQQLELQGNALTGSIPPELGALVNLQYLGLHENQLLGEIPKELGRLTRLKHLALCNNRLVGGIPEELGNLSALEQMYFNHNHLSGPIPSSLGSLSNLNKLRLESNQLSGPIPVELGRLSRLQYVNFGFNGAGNSLTGEIPVKAFANMPQLAWLSMTDNPCLVVKRGRFGTSTLSLLKKVLPARCDVFV